MKCAAHEFGCGCEQCRAHYTIMDEPPVDWRPFRIASYILIALCIALGGIGAKMAAERVNHEYSEANQ